MRALLCRRWCEFNDLELEEVPSPSLLAGSVRIRVHYASISFAINLMVAGKYQHKSSLPFIPGKEVAGIVVEVAAGTSRLKPGDRVVAIVDEGGYADEVIAPEEMVYQVPAALDLKSAIHLPLSYGTAFAALHWRAGLQAGETLLVHGAAGGVGSAATQLGHQLGARVIATAGSEQRRRFTQANGAFCTLPPAGFRDAVKAETGGRGADVIFDPVGGGVFDESLRCIAQGGRIIVIGFASGRVPQIPANILLVKNVTVHGFYFGSYTGTGIVDDRKLHAPRIQQMMGTLFEWSVSGQISPTVSASFPLHQYRQAMSALTSRVSLGKVVLEIHPQA